MGSPASGEGEKRARPRTKALLRRPAQRSLRRLCDSLFPAAARQNCRRYRENAVAIAARTHAVAAGGEFVTGDRPPRRVEGKESAHLHAMRAFCCRPRASICSRSRSGRSAPVRRPRPATRDPAGTRPRRSTADRTPSSSRIITTITATSPLSPKFRGIIRRTGADPRRQRRDLASPDRAIGRSIRLATAQGRPARIHLSRRTIGAPRRAMRGWRCGRRSSSRVLGTRIYFAGDTGYATGRCSGHRARTDRFRLALLPIAATRRLVHARPPLRPRRGGAHFHAI